MKDRDKLIENALAKRGMWIGVYADHTVPGGCLTYGKWSNEDPHITLAHLGRSNTEKSVDDAIAALASAAKQTWVINARVHAVARFKGSIKEGDPLVALMRSESNGFRSAHISVMAALRTRGIHADDRFDFLPHMTIARVPRTDTIEMHGLDGVTSPMWVYSSISLVCGDARATFNLSPPVF